MKPVTRKRLLRSELDLQAVAALVSPHVGRAVIRRIHGAMRVLNEAAMEMRRREIFAAGARARKPVPKFEGRPLGSAESMTFYDGHASKHPGFVNPYRSVR